MNLYFYIFIYNLLISTFTFGGGYVVIPMMRKYFVEKRPLLKEQDLMELAAVSQSAPGAIAVNLAVGVAFKIKGLKGALSAMTASVLPAFLILSIISTSYEAFRSNVYISAALQGMEACVAAIMVDVVITMIQSITKEQDKKLVAFIPISFIAIYFFNCNTIIVLLSCLCVSLFICKRRLSTCA